MAKFTIIVPVYNVEMYLKKCIQSLINQNYSDIEIILVDDGSTDNSGSICDRYALKDNRILVIHKSNGGIVSARNSAMEHATGDYIIFVDSDDAISHDYCSKMNDIIQNYQPDIVCCGHYKMYPSHNEQYKLNFRYGYYTKQDIQNEIYPILLQDKKAKGFNLSVWAKAVKRTLAYEYRLKNTFVNMGEDVAWMAPCVFHANSLVIMEECLYYYRQSPTSITKSKKVFRWDGPEIRARHIENKIDLNIGDLRDQHYRNIVHSLFTVAKSQFNNNEMSFFKVSKGIKKELNYPYYRNAICNAVFSGVKGNIMKYTLKYKLTILIKLFNR